MSIASRIQEIETHIGDVYDTINYSYDTTGINKNIINIPKYLKKGYVDIINNGTDTLYNNFPKVSGIGSNLSLTPTYEAPMKLNEIQGDTSQDGTPTPDTPVEIQSVTGLQNINVCGKNLFDKTTIKSGYLIQVNGNEIANTSYGASDYIPVKANTQYTRVNCNNYYGAFYDSNKNFVGAIQNANTITPSVDGYVRISFLLTNIDSVQLEKGSTATTCEPYKGNTYEVNLGKNLFNSFIATKPSWQSGNLEINEDGSFTVSENPGSNNYFQTSQKLKDFCPSLNVGDTVYLYLETTNSNKNIYIGQSWINGESKTLTETMLNSNFIIYGGYGQTDTIKIMITKGLDTNYSPYFTPIELNKIGDYQDVIKRSSGKNLFDKDNIVSGKRLNNSGGATIDEPSYCTTNYFIPVNPNTSYYSSVAISQSRAFCFYDSSKNFISRTMYTGQNVITTTSDTYYMKISILLSEIDTLMLNEGSTATTYEPYGKVWYVEKNIGKVVLDGSENWDYNIANEVFILSDYVNYLITGFIPYSNYYKGASVSSYSRLNNNEISFLTSTTSNRILIKNTNFTVPNDFKNWLSTHNTEVLYVLATPTYTEITNTELIEDLETLYTAKSQEGTTNISITSEDLEMILNVSALKGDA